MKSVVDSRLRREARDLVLRFGCEHCAHYDERAAVCSFGFPTAPHFAIDLDAVDSLEFCKGFELGG